MSSGFVSGGTVDAPIERSDEWLEAQKQIEANRALKAEQARRQDGKSLFETLEANKGTFSFPPPSFVLEGIGAVGWRKVPIEGIVLGWTVRDCKERKD